MFRPKSRTASEPSDGITTDMNLEPGIAGGTQGTVIRDAEGAVVYPAPLPPETQSPTAGLSPTPVGEAVSHSVTLASDGSRKAKSRPVEPASVGRSVARERPSMSKQWATEMPNRTNRETSVLPPRIKRAGTNVSEVQTALWTENSREDDDASSSSSSSSSEDESGDVDETDFAAKKVRSQQRINNNQYRRFRVGNENYRTKGKVSKKDGRLSISLKDTSNTGFLVKALGAAVRKVVPLGEEGETEEAQDSQTPLTLRDIRAEDVRCPKLNIVIMVIGSRGDAQPFLKIGKILKEKYGHRVRIATHPAFREFVEKDSGLEFFSVGGDPAELMAFMVKNPGMIPTLESVKAGDIGRRRAAMAEMFQGFWRACINATDDEKDIQNLKMMGVRDPFVADAIIANPPSFAHVHCAEALGIPVHMMFTFPYTPTQAFPHPLASIKKSNVDPGYTNFISYPLVEMMVWQGLGDLVNDFRMNTLGLDPVSTLWAPGATYRLHVPFTYLWSPGLVPKPEDWGDEIDISGFVFLDLASSFTPPDGLVKFLDSGEPPIYIGFGSIVVDDPEHFTEMIFEAVKLAGVRALVSKGWGGLGNENVPDDIYMLGNTPHDWLFPKVRACVIHGGAGTTAIAMKCGKPTMVVPFFGDQHFWGSMLERSYAGPEPVPYKNLTAEKLAEGIKYCLTEDAHKAAQGLARDIEREGDGAENACKSFHQHLALSGEHSMRCSLLGEMVAVWYLKHTDLRLSPLAADILVSRGYLSWNKLRLVRHCEWNDFEGPGEPVTGVAGSLISTVGNVFGGIGGVPARLAKSSHKRKERRERKKLRRRREMKQQTPEKGPVEGPAQNGSAGVPQSSIIEGQDSLHTDALNTSSDEDDQNAEVVSLQATTTTRTEEHVAEEIVASVGKGLSKSAHAIARAPVDLSMAVAQGFHNAPRLYGDDTVRRPPRVTGIQSGLRAARAEFAYGIYDAWTGLVRLPVRGVRAGGGAKGFAKGVGMGITGFVLKDIAAVTAPVGYTLKGMKKQVERRRQPIKYVRRARIIQGQREVRTLSVEDRKAKVREVERGWEVMRALWEAVEKQEKDKGGVRAIMGAKRKRGLGAAFESVDIAEKALAAVRRGEDVDVVVKHVRRSDEAMHNGGQPLRNGSIKPVAKKKSSHEKGRDPDNVHGTKKVSVTEPITETGESSPEHTERGERTRGGGGIGSMA